MITYTPLYGLVGNSDSKQFHILGSGISFSISPIIHNAGFKHYGLPYTYDIRESASIDDVSHLIADPRFGGASVMMPHKLHVHKYCMEQTQTARLIGAINTLVVRGNGSERTITGDNTDWSGLHSIISDFATGVGRQPNVGLVIGAGGASRAALFALYKAGLKQIYLVNRTLAVADKVKADFHDVFEMEVIPNLQALPQLPEIIIGTVPADTTTEAGFANIFGTGGQGLCIEMAYKPRQTPLLSVAQRTAGWHTVSGVEVLLAQAFDQFQLWTGLEAPRGQMVAAVAAHEREQAKLA